MNRRLLPILSMFSFSLLMQACAAGEESSTVTPITPDAGSDSKADSKPKDVGGTKPDSTLPETEDDTGVGILDTQVPGDDASDVSFDVSTIPDSTSSDANAESGSDAGNCGAVWPGCESAPQGASASTIKQLWTDNPSSPSFRFVSGAVVTAISQGGCNGDRECQIFIQDPSAPTGSLTEVSQHAVKIFISKAAAPRFTSVKIGDKIDVAAYAWRYNVGGQNELLLQIADSCALRGCIKSTGTGTVNPTPATIQALSSYSAYETQVGPVLVKLSNVACYTDNLTPLTSMTNGLFTPGVFNDAGVFVPLKISPFFLPGSSFNTYLVPTPTAYQRIDFNSLTAVFGMVLFPASGDAGAPTKFLALYPRAASDFERKL